MIASTLCGLDRSRNKHQALQLIKCTIHPTWKNIVISKFSRSLGFQLFWLSIRRNNNTLTIIVASNYHRHLSTILLPGASIHCFLLPYLNDTRRPHIGNVLSPRYAKGLAQLRFYLPFLLTHQVHIIPYLHCKITFRLICWPKFQ